MVDSGPYPGDGQGQPPRKHRSGRTGTHDRDSEFSDGYGNERNQDERRQKRHRDRHQNHEERGPRRPREDVERSQYQEREQRREERGQSRQQRDRGRDGHRERDQHHEDGGHSRSHPEKSQNDRADGGHSRSHPERSQNDHADGGHSRSHPERSQHHYKDREDYKSEKSYSQYQGREDHHKERNQNRYVEWERQQERYAHSPDRRDSPTHSKFPEHYNPSERSFPPDGAQMHDLEYYEEREGGILDCHKCRYLCTGRGILQMLEVILNALVLICLISSYFALSGFSAGMASGGFGGGYYPFEGQELQEVRQLDQEFSLRRAPLLYGGLAVTLLMGTLTLAILAAGSKHLLRLSDRWLVIEAAFSSLASLGFGAAVGVFLHFALQINATDVCKRRERLYARNGLTWMNCNLAGTDGGAATFAILLVIIYCASAVLAVRAYREKKYLQQ